MKEENNKKKKIVIIVVAAILLVAAVITFLYFRSQIRATTMRILRIEGEVTLEDNGKPKTITNNLRLNSGNALSTAVKSLVSIGLDEVKIVTLDERSRAVFNQKGRQLDLELTDGSLFFEVQQPLEADETMDIRTSTMVVGIRGTSGWVSVDGEHEQLIVTDGTVHVIGTNPVTGEVKEIDVKSGQRITVYLYNDRSVDSIMFVLEDVTERDLPEFLLERLRENRDLLEKVCRETGWDKPWILGLTEEDIPKVVIDSNETNDTDGSDDVAEVEDTAEIEPEEPENNEKPEEDGVLTKEELAWAHSHIMFIDPGTGIFALKDTTLFDPTYYALTNPDVVAKYGTDPDALLWHYLQRGKKEGRPPIAPPTPTPTPTPTWVSTNDSGEDPYKEEEEEEEPEPTATPAAQATVQTNYSSVANNADKISLSPTAQIPVNAYQAYSNPARQFIISGTNGYLNVTGGTITFELPLSINSNYNGGTVLTYNLDQEAAGNHYVSVSNTAPQNTSVSSYERVGGNTDIVVTQTMGANNNVSTTYHYGDNGTNYENIALTQGNNYRLYNTTNNDEVYIRRSDGYVSTSPLP